MNRALFTFCLVLAFSLGVNGQERTQLNLKKVSPEKRKELISKLSPEQKRELYRDYRKNALMEELKIRKEDQAAFGKIYSDYQESQRRIKDRFDGNFDPDQLSEEQARKRLEDSFQYGEQLINNRREYAKKMQQVVKPQQVIKMFRVEGQMRDRMLERRMNMKNTPEQSSNRASAPSRNAPISSGGRGSR